jgi:hypothetical protein
LFYAIQFMDRNTQLGTQPIPSQAGEREGGSRINGHFLANTTKHENMEQPASAVLKGIMAGSARPTDWPVARQ